MDFSYRNAAQVGGAKLPPAHGAPNPRNGNAGHRAHPRVGDQGAAIEDGKRYIHLGSGAND